MHAAETSDSGPVFLLFPSYFSSPSSSFNYLNLLFLFVLVGFLFFSPFFLLFFFTFSVLFCCETAGFIFFSLCWLFLGITCRCTWTNKAEPGAPSVLHWLTGKLIARPGRFFSLFVSFFGGFFRVAYFIHCWNGFRLSAIHPVGLNSIPTSKLARSQRKLENLRESCKS